MIPTSEEIQLAEAEFLHNLIQDGRFPSFEKFKKNPDKWRNHEEDIFVSLEQMECFFKKRVKAVSYYWRGKYKCRSLQELQAVTRNEGYKGSDLEYQPIARPSDGTSNLHDSKVDIRVNIYSKIEFRLMGGKVAND